MINEFEGSLAKKRGETACMNRETGWCDNTDNLYPIPQAQNLKLVHILLDYLTQRWMIYSANNY